MATSSKAGATTSNSEKPPRPIYESALLDEHPAAAIAPLSPELAAKVAASDYSDELIARLLAVRPDREMIEAWIDAGFPTPSQAEHWVEASERLLASTLVCRAATWADNDMLVELCANSPETVGEWSVTVERGPNPYAQYRLQENTSINVLEDRRVGLGMTAASSRNTYIGGERTSVHFMSGWRVRDGFRGMGLSNLLRTTGGDGTGFFGLVSYYYVRQQNSSATWIASIEADSEDRPEGFGAETDILTSSVTVFPCAENGGLPTADTTGSRVIREATEADLPRCIELINRTHGGLDLFRPYTLEFLGGRLDDPNWGPKPPFIPPVYGWPDFRVVEDSGRVVACGGLWDRGRDIREVWAKDDRQFVSDPTALMDFGFDDGADAAMAELIDHFVAQSNSLGRSGMLAGLEWLPELQDRTRHLRPELDTRELHVLPFSMPDLTIELSVTRPYTDIAYW